MRAFLAIPVPEQALPGLTALQTPLKAGRPADTFHLTLAFLGDLSTRQLDDLHAELETVAVRPFDLHLAGLDGPGLDRYEALLDEADHDVVAWVMGARHVPARHDNGVFRLLRDATNGS